MAALYQGRFSDVSIDKVVIHGAEFTRVSGKYLLQSEVEQAMVPVGVGTAPHVERLTTLLEDIVTAADRVALEVVEMGLESQRSPVAAIPTTRLDTTSRSVLIQIRDAMSAEIERINNHLNRRDG